MRRVDALASAVAACAFLIAVSVSVNADVTLVQAVKTGNVQTVRAMVKAKADTNSAEPDGTTALHWAVQNGNV